MCTLVKGGNFRDSGPIGKHRYLHAAKRKVLVAQLLSLETPCKKHANVKDSSRGDVV
jgi:hypothetical protein